MIYIYVIYVLLGIVAVLMFLLYKELRYISRQIAESSGIIIKSKDTFKVLRNWLSE